MTSKLRRRTPEEFLRECQAEEAALTRGRLKIFLGYASGVGKSFRMFDEARRRRERGQDVVVAAVQKRVPLDVAQLLKNLEVVPLRDETAIDVAAVLIRRPAICIVDGLAFGDPPRWQEVRSLLNAGIHVIASINIRYVVELREKVEAITGRHVNYTVPIAFLESADEIEVVDAPEESPQLSKLRELALVLAADVVDHQLDGFGVTERILICVTPRANIQDMLQTGLTIAGRFHGELMAAYVNQPQLSAADRKAINQKLEMARAAGAHVEILESDDPAKALTVFAKSRGVTQLFVGHTQRSGIKERFSENPIDKFLRLSQGMDVRIFPQ